MTAETGKLIDAIAQLDAEVAQLQSQLAESEAAYSTCSLGRDILNKTVAELQKQLLEYEQTEAAVCPEDVGVQEYVGQLHSQLATARETNKSLHRRCQLAESAVKENIAACKKQGQSLGRRLSASGYLMLEAELTKAKKQVEEYKDALAVKFNAEMCEALKPIRDKLVSLQETVKYLRTKAEFDMPDDMHGRFHNGQCPDACDMIDGLCACGASHNVKEWIGKLNKKLEAEQEKVKRLRWFVASMRGVFAYNEYPVIDMDVLFKCFRAADCEDFTKDVFSGIETMLIESGLSLLPTTNKAIRLYGSDAEKQALKENT